LGLTSADNRADGLAIPQPRFYVAARATDAVARLLRTLPWGICAITALAAALRLAELDDVVGNPFYDAAVHSMGLSWHNFLFGAFDPGAMLAVDKPPLDLWLQVGSVKSFGWSLWALKLPEAIGGTLAVPLLYDAVRRAVGRGAGLAAAAALAVVPVSVLTSRSDTMDSLMMLCVVAALWLTIQATALGSRRSLVLAGVALGLAFNVKLLEGLVALPALIVLYATGAPVPRRWRTGDIALAGLALVVVSLSWAVVVTVAPGRHPFSAGSANGTVFDAIFQFNGLGRLAGTLPAGGVYSAPPGALRLFNGVGSIGRLFGVLLLAALALGAGALIVEWRRHAAGQEPRRSRMELAFSLAVIVWLGCGVALLSFVSLLHARYLEMVTPAVAAAIGVALASLVDAIRAGGHASASFAGALWSGGRGRTPVLLLAAGLAGVCSYTSTLASSSVARAAGFAAAAVIVATLAIFVPRAARLLAGASGVLALTSCLSFPVRESDAIVRQARSDSVGLPVHPRKVEAALSRYLRRRTRGVRYELAADDPLKLAPLLIHDSRPILPLTSFAGIPVVRLGGLRHAVSSGAVRYALIASYPCAGGNRGAACVPAAIWVRRHGIDVSDQAGIPRGQRLKLYRLPG
jgi:4-amino-4-deoxy-L-arabinose transferase-like glycosyltransferase